MQESQKKDKKVDINVSKHLERGFLIMIGRLWRKDIKTSYKPLTNLLNKSWKSKQISMKCSMLNAFEI